MGAYLIDNKPAVQQFYKTRSKPLTGCTVLHTAESVMDTVGPDTGAENVANFIRTRTTAGSYHDLADSDSYINLVPYASGAFHDGTGSNNWALSISWACGTHHWRAMTPERRAGFLRQGARAFAAQQAYRRSVGAPLTELRRITKAQSDAGASGFIYHGDRDPGRRTDPGKTAPNLFPFDEWIDHCRAALAGTTTAPGGDWFDMATKEDLLAVLRGEGISGAGDPATMLKRGYDKAIRDGVTAVLRSEGVSGAGDVGRVVAAIRAELPAEAGTGYSLADVEAAAERAVRRVAADAGS